MSKTAFATMLALAAGLTAAAPTLARQAPPAAPPPATSQDPAAAPAGAYNIDLNHSSVIARITHGRGVSYSTLRFGVTKGVLTWDPSNPAAIRLEATVDAKPHYEPIVYRVGPEAEQLLNAAKFPAITFVSTGVTKTGATKADVKGDLTLLGVSKPVVLHLELVGVSKNNQGVPVVGFTGALALKRSDYGSTFLAGSVGDAVSITLDGEFIKE